MQVLVGATRMVVFPVEAHKEEADTRDAGQDHAGRGFYVTPEADVHEVI